MGTWDAGIYDSDGAADIIYELSKKLEKEFVNCGPEELLAISDILLFLDSRPGLGSPDRVFMEKVFEKLKKLHNDKEYYKEWGTNKRRHQRAVRTLLNRFSKVMLK